MFTDKVEIDIKAGNGGDGRLSFRHEKFRAMGGPDGGDGGRGGDIVFVCDHNLDTLSYYRTTKRLAAPDGQPGGTNRKAGRSGAPAIVKVPVGTVAYKLVRGASGDTGSAPPTKTILADLAIDAQTEVLARGGRGGYGNAHFTASTRQAPRLAERGEPGQMLRVALELKLVADVGLVGLPNAGKSTLLSVISNAKPEIADYPFTTLVPNLGVVDVGNMSMLVADIPGLIEGASRGRGLGDEFLRHIERTSVLVHLIDVRSDDVARDYETIQRELAEYVIDLTAKPQLVVLTKIDGMPSKEVEAARLSLSSRVGGEVFAISAVARQGLDEVLRLALREVRSTRLAAQVAAADALPVIDESSLPEMWRVEAEGPGVWRVSGERLEGFGRRTNWDSPDGVARLRDIMRKTGVARQLKRQGAQPGDTIKLGEGELEWLS